MLSSLQVCRAQHSSMGCGCYWCCTGSQGSCSGFNSTLVYLSVQSLPFSFNRVPASLRPSILVFISPLPSALAWWSKRNLARQGLLLCLLFISPSCSVCLYSTPLIWPLRVDPSWSMFLPLLLSLFPLPQLLQGSQKRGASPGCSCRTSLCNRWLSSSIQLCRSGAGNHLAAPCSGALNCLPAEKRLLESCSDWC